jgi:hypothetical protein
MALDACRRNPLRLNPITPRIALGPMVSKERRMTRRAYLDVLMKMPADLISKSLASPSASLRPVHLALHRIALRRKTGGWK